jgi:uncharacterized OB-fold protein
VGADRVPIAPDLFTDGDKPQLMGSRCGACDVVTFPRQGGCPRCGAADMRDELLHRRGTLYTWTTQGFPPKEPYRINSDEPFRPFLLGYVELPGQVRVEARLVNCDGDAVRIGMEMELSFFPLRHDDEGREVMRYAFEPARSRGNP